MLIKFLLLIISNHFRDVHPECIYEEPLISCKSQDIIQFYEDFNKHLYYSNDTVGKMLEILDTDIPILEHLYDSPKMDKIEYLKMWNCGIADIDDSAFDDFSDLKELDLSYNVLEEATFINNLSKMLKILTLRHNLISHIETDFAEFQFLVFVDLSFNNIKVLNLEYIRTLIDINFSHNEINVLIPCKSETINSKKHSRLNLNSNKIVTFDESDLCMNINWLELGSNPLKTVSLKDYKKFISLAYTQIETFEGFIAASYVDLRSIADLYVINIISGNLILGNNHLNNLGDYESDIRKFYDSEVNLIEILDLSNSSITNIPDYYFANLEKCSFIGLSHNNINTIYRTTFENASISILDLSNSNIQNLRSYSFANTTFKELRLNNNQITELVTVLFYNSSIIKINLSNNLITEINDNSFEFLFDLKILDLSYNEITTIAALSLADLHHLEILILRNNKITRLSTNTFLRNHRLKMIHLDDNQIEVVEKKAFCRLDDIKKLNLSDLYIKIVETNAFTHLSVIKEINLANNKIEVIDVQLFFDTPRLKKLDLSGNPIKHLNHFSNDLIIQELLISLGDDLTVDRISNVHLKSLTIKDSNLERLKENIFKGLYELSYLYFVNSSVCTIENGAFNDLFSLEYFDSQNLFKNITILTPRMFQDLGKLQHLNLSNVAIEKILSGSFEGLDNVIDLNLQQSQIKIIVTDLFIGLFNLENLLLNGNRITTIEQGGFNNLHLLKVLDLSGNALEKLPDGVFNDLVSLTNLYLQENKFRSLESEYFKGISNLLEINLSNNNLAILRSGIFRYLTELKYLYLKYNQLSLIEHGSISTLKNLEILELSGNELENINVSLAFTNLHKLNRLYLSYNALTTLDVDDLLYECDKLTEVGISFNNWQCENLSHIISTLIYFNVKFNTEKSIYSTANIAGIECVSDGL